ncbi:vWA domain-containing protein [Paraliomyxa miuraensis]|uniref:vWA domain-containing protein n=1 Tax=Paraliomyxa miuraensis TaxID=376150 RepID=UPI00225113D5|nr:vWA domain-containing protein [Paraliomyxa miuraensis]MCX4241214.1 VWA domain-containing protein [Paraliomyxa miuraensis]
MPSRPDPRRFVAALSLLAALVPSTAAADEVWGTRSEKLVERSHEIHLVLDHGVATLRARRTVFNGGERHDQAVMFLDLPSGAVATGLRTKGTLRGRPHWFQGELLEAELAAARYQELTGIGGYYPKDPALLSWRDQSLLALQVFPVAPGTDKTVEYTLQIPTEYDDGRDHLELPAMGTEAHPARVVLQTVDPRDQLFVDGDPVARGYPLILDDDRELALARHRAPRIDATLAAVPFGAEGVLLHYDVALAPTLSTIPRNARVVVLIDGSFSMGEVERQVAIAAARSYLEHFTGSKLGAQAEVVTFDRKVSARHDGLVPVREAIADLDHLQLPGANGSAVDDALARAHALLEDAPEGPRRVLLLTDARTRDALQPERLRTLAERTGAIVHVGTVEAGEASLQRLDDHEWASVATVTGGVTWALALDPEGPRDEPHAVLEELARPVRIDHLQVAVAPLSDPRTDIPETLDEGQGLAVFTIVTDSVDHLRIEGQLWSTPVKQTVFPDAAQGRRWAALLFGDDLLYELDEEQMMPLALHGGVVSPVTSYLAIEPGVRPSTEGLDESEGLGLIGRGGGGGSGSIGLGSTGMIGFGGRDMRQEILERRVREALDACGGQMRAIRLTLETTLDEIVQVEPPTIGGAKDAVLEQCLVDGVWETPLPPIFNDEWKRWAVDLQG